MSNPLAKIRVHFMDNLVHEYEICICAISSFRTMKEREELNSPIEVR